MFLDLGPFVHQTAGFRVRPVFHISLLWVFGILWKEVGGEWSWLVICPVLETPWLALSVVHYFAIHNAQCKWHFRDISACCQFEENKTKKTVDNWFLQLVLLMSSNVASMKSGCMNDYLHLSNNVSYFSNRTGAFLPKTPDSDHKTFKTSQVCSVFVSGWKLGRFKHRWPSDFTF